MYRQVKRNIDSIATALIKNPLATNKAVAKAAGVSLRTVERRSHMVAALDSVKKDDRIISLTDDDFKILRLAQGHLKERLTTKETADKIPARDLNYIADVAAKRYAIFRGELTDKEGGLKNPVAEMSTDELLKLANIVDI